MGEVWLATHIAELCLHSLPKVTELWEGDAFYGASYDALHTFVCNWKVFWSLRIFGVLKTFCRVEGLQVSCLWFIRSFIVFIFMWVPCVDVSLVEMMMMSVSVCFAAVLLRFSSSMSISTTRILPRRLLSMVGLHTGRLTCPLIFCDSFPMSISTLMCMRQQLHCISLFTGIALQNFPPTWSETEVIRPFFCNLTII